MTTDNYSKIGNTKYGGKGWGGGWIMRFMRAEDGAPRHGTYQKLRYAVFRVFIPYGTPGGIYRSTVQFTVEIDDNPIKAE
jgi:hypothetical protein